MRKLGNLVDPFSIALCAGIILCFMIPIAMNQLNFEIIPITGGTCLAITVTLCILGIIQVYSLSSMI